MEPSLVVSCRVRSAASLTEQNVAKDDDHLQSTDSAFFALTDFRQDPLSRWMLAALSMLLG